jgi:hypothetical protein
MVKPKKGVMAFVTRCRFSEGGLPPWLGKSKGPRNPMNKPKTQVTYVTKRARRSKGVRGVPPSLEGVPPYPLRGLRREEGE